MTHFALALILTLWKQLEPAPEKGCPAASAGVCVSIVPEYVCPEGTVMLTFEDGQKWCRKVYRKAPLPRLGADELHDHFFRFSIMRSVQALISCGSCSPNSLVHSGHSSEAMKY